MKALPIILIVVGGAAVLGAVACFFFMKGPDLKPYLTLKEPRLAQRPAERVLEVKFSGSADKAVKEAFGVLFKAYYGTKGSPKGPGMKCPKARYQIAIDLSVPAERRFADLMGKDWSGSVAIPVPDSLVLAEPKLGAGQKPNADGMRAEIGTWEYGEVAEILHLGPYEDEAPTIHKLEDFIKAQGYKVIGDHEEEYLKGPGMPFVFPKDYWTIIRYRVERAK